MRTIGFRIWRSARLAAGLAAIAVFPVRAETPQAKPEPAGLAQRPSPRAGVTADHSKFKILQQDFKSAQDVTAACLTCHTEAAKQVMGSLHWTWHFTHPKTGQELGKSKVINSFCGNVAANEPRCTSCHAGYGWEKMADGPPKQETAVDCLVCHAAPGRYAKLDNEAGLPPLAPLPPKAKTITGADATPVDLSKAAMSVGLPTRENCGQCHFYGGGGDNVKHGDLSSVLFNPSRSVDVHMSKDGANLTCADCHVTKAHKSAGSRYAVTAADTIGTGKPGERRDVATCQSCHGTRPHKGLTLEALTLNDHTNRVACQTCHIPSFARGGVATKTKWDWSTAGQLKDGKPFHKDDFVQSDGKHLHTYLSTKGDFQWGENVTPYYAWFDGQVRYTTGDDKIDPSKPVEINHIEGNPNDPNARIWPFKKMVGRQAYDTELLHLVHNQVYGPTTTTAFWTNFDWSKSIKAAMDYIGAPYSGHFGFVDTRMYWPITHMVAPKDQALSCNDCHQKNRRLASLTSTVYMPGTRPPGLIDWLGFGMVAAAFFGVVAHAGLRTLARSGRPPHGGAASDTHDEGGKGHD
ncbi:tetrathionate reductase family octaheme c-type cytochrome [Xanthobacter sp. DSM 24535]|uniref:tetrathionate reductase family octaheme c-type cytochrome n=1 Tax=Roseixanthobacter psychrophilus TaxID=3119917 RepID=UPI00372ACCD0